jgi:hypothetical protein
MKYSSPFVRVSKDCATTHPSGVGKPIRCHAKSQCAQTAANSLLPQLLTSLAKKKEILPDIRNAVDKALARLCTSFVSE